MEDPNFISTWYKNIYNRRARMKTFSQECMDLGKKFSVKEAFDKGLIKEGRFVKTNATRSGIYKSLIEGEIANVNGERFFIRQNKHNGDGMYIDTKSRREQSKYKYSWHVNTNNTRTHIRVYKNNTKSKLHKI